jgi:hypothetical protein
LHSIDVILKLILSLLNSSFREFAN